MNKYSNKYPMYTNEEEHGKCHCRNHQPKSNSNYNPFYVPEGMQRPAEDNDLDDYDENERQYMISMYPDLCKRIQHLAEKECDQLEYEDSFMFDEYPDINEIDKIVARIYVVVEKEQVLPNVAQEIGDTDAGIEAQQVIIPAGNPWLWNNVQVGFLNEMYNRRRRRYPRNYIYSYPIQQYPRYRQYFYPNQIFIPYNQFVPYQPYDPYFYRY